MTVAPERFIEFARLKLAADGSDSYIMGVVELARRYSDQYWYAGVFTAFCSLPSQEIFADRWSRNDMLTRPDEILAWTIEHWNALPIGSTRRTNRMGPHKLITTLSGYARWLESGGPSRINSSSFDGAFKQLLGSIPNHGRYTSIKLYEILRRIGADLPAMDDIRPKGGRTPRRALNMIYGHDHHHDTPLLLAEANALADELRGVVPTTWFNVEMLLCNFSKAVKGSYYPGLGLDHELANVNRVRAIFCPDAGSLILEQRARLFPRACLGELSGWSGRRDELEKCLSIHGYFWSDLLYDYGATTDLARPITRDISVFLPPLLKGYGEEPS